MRFDYFGIGDSAGESAEASIDGAVEDTLTAIEELRNVAQVRRLTLIGLRLGAVIAARAARQSKQVDRLVLWDPVSDGRALESVLQRRAVPAVTDADTLELAGFPFPDRLQREIAAVAETAFESPPAEVLLAVSDDRPEHRALASTLSRAGAHVAFSLLPNAPCWSEQGDLGVGAMPADMVEFIAGWSP